MLKPHKFLDYKNSVIRVSGLILKVLKDLKVVKYNDLYNMIYKLVGEDLQYSFLPSLDFIYLLGKIEYNEESDTLELI